MKLRAAAAHIIHNILKGHKLSEILPKTQALFSDSRDQALLQAISFGVCRRYFYLDAIANERLAKPLKTKDQDIHCLILVGLYQLIEMRIPPHAAIAETVEAATEKKPWAKRLINAILRGYQRDATTINQTILDQPEALYDHPTWMIEKLKAQWPTEWPLILKANNQQPPFALRINQQRMTREKYLEQYSISHSKARPITETTSGIIVEPACDITDVPGFSSGELSVQDGAAQLAASLLQLKPGLRVLDACAAPGGKTAHILESEPAVTLIAIDCDATRILSIEENLQRLKLSATCLHADAANIDAWWDGIPFDRILLDAPCSASGVIRRHPDIKLLRKAEDVKNITQQQKRLLNAMWQVLKPGGCLVYATCSIFLEENARLLSDFLDKNSNAEEEKITTSWGIPLAVGKQILPGQQDMDGFYYGCLRKKY